MDRRLVAIIASAALLGVMVAVVLVARGDGGGDSPAAEVSTDLGEKPQPAIPEEAPPAELVSDDIVEGTARPPPPATP